MLAVLQTKFGPVDFQIREPFHPLFGALPRTNSMMEVQITQEYTGGSKTICYLVPLWKDILDSDTHADGPGSEVAEVIDGSLHGYQRFGMAGVANIGDDRNWTGHHLAAANTYGFGRLAWNSGLDTDQLTDEWVRLTFGHSPAVVRTIRAMLLDSPGIFEDYTSPLGVGKMGVSGSDLQRLYPDLAGREWYHKSDETGTGFDRTAATGTGFTAQYHEPVASRLESLADCPEELLLFFHHVPYTHRLRRIAPGKTVIQHIYDTHFDGADAVMTRLRQPWLDLAGQVDNRRHREVLERVDEQVELAKIWRDAVVWYYFDKSGILDEQGRMGIRMSLAVPAVTVMAGHATSVPLLLINASQRDTEVRIQLESPAGWSSGTVTRLLVSGERAEVPIDITAPARIEPGEHDLTLLLTSTGDQQRVTIPVLSTVPGNQAVLALDVGTATSPVLGSYTRLAPENAWSEAAGYGWVGTPPGSRDRGTGDDLLRDFTLSVDERVLRIAVPPGRHRVFFLCGDSTSGAGTTRFSVDGQLLAETGSLSRGMFRWVTSELDGGPAGQSIDLHLSGSGTSNWRLNALVLLGS